MCDTISARSDCLHPKAGMQKQAMWSNVFVPESSVSQQAVRVPLGVRERIELGEKKYNFHRGSKYCCSVFCT